MNPERNRGGMTVNALMQLELLTSIGYSRRVTCFTKLVINISSDHFSLMIAVLICAVVVLLSIMVTSIMSSERSIQDRIQQD